MKVAGLELQVDGRLLRIARLAMDTYESVDDPGATLEALRAERNALIAEAVRTCAERKIAHLLYASFALGPDSSPSTAATLPGAASNGDSSVTGH